VLFSVEFSLFFPFLGASIRSMTESVWGTLIASLVCTVVFLIAHSTTPDRQFWIIQSEYLALFLLFACCAVGAYFFKEGEAKRMYLGSVAIMFIDFHRSRNERIVAFSFWIIGDIVIGAACGVIALILPFPRTALAETEGRLALVFQTTFNAFFTLLASFRHPDKVHASILNATALRAIHQAQAGLDEILVARADAKWEKILRPWSYKRTVGGTRTAVSNFRVGFGGCEGFS
jgi:hypothetical protein